MSVRGAVDAVVVTFAMPPLGRAVTPLLTFVICVSEFFFVVAVRLTAAVVGVAAPATVDDVPTVVVVSPESVVSVPACSVTAVVLAPDDFLSPPPPHAARTRPHAAATAIAEDRQARRVCRLFVECTPSP
jgi:hypothetical protein